MTDREIERMTRTPLACAIPRVTREDRDGAFSACAFCGEELLPTEDARHSRRCRPILAAVERVRAEDRRALRRACDAADRELYHREETDRLERTVP